MSNYNMCVPCLLGMEKPIADELVGMGADNVEAENGRVLFSGDEHILARVNICSRYSERVLILTGHFEAHTFDELFENTKKIRWADYIGMKDKFPVKGYCLNSDLFSVRDCQAIIKKAVVESLKSRYRTDWFEETGSLYQIQFSVFKNDVSLFIDTSGTALHKRGYRPQANAAPIKETLAAAMCYFSHLRDYHTLYDPMCGSGTVAVEGALLAANIAPGINREFTAEAWRNINHEVWTEERDRAKSLEKKDISFFCFASDIDSHAVNTAKLNAKRAGVEKYIKFGVSDIKDFSPSTEKGTVITNPPYGERLSDIKSAEKLYREMGKIFIPKKGWSYSIIASDEDFEKNFGRKADKRRKLYNGMIKCQLYMYFKY